MPVKARSLHIFLKRSKKDILESVFSIEYVAHIIWTGPADPKL